MEPLPVNSADDPFAHTVAVLAGTAPPVPDLALPTLRHLAEPDDEPDIPGWVFASPTDLAAEHGGTRQGWQSRQKRYRQRHGLE